MQKFKPKLFTTISLAAIFLFCLILVVIRWLNIFNKNIIVVNETVNSHITNFTISILMCVLIGYLLLMAGKKYSSNVIVGIILILANFIYETFLSVLNTTDIIDAVYGLLGVLISLIYLYFINRYGFNRYGFIIDK